jgi:trigger factor
MEPNEFIKTISENNQVPSFVAEAARRKALSLVLEASVVTDSKGKAVDLSEFTKADVQAFSDNEDHTGHDHA